METIDFTNIDSVDAAIATIFLLNDGSDKLIHRAIFKNRTELNKKFGKEAVTKELSDLYHLYSDSDSTLLVGTLKLAYNTTHRVAEKIAETYLKDDFLLVAIGELLFIVHPSTKPSHVKHPIQVSVVSEKNGVIGDSLHATVCDAIRHRQLEQGTVISNDEFSAIEDRVVEAETRYQANIRNYREKLIAS